MRTHYLSGRQRAMLRFIRKHLMQFGYSPTIREIGNACGISSSSVTLSNLRTLNKYGHITRKEGTSRAIGLVEKPVTTPKRKPLTPAQVSFLLSTRKAQTAHAAFQKSLGTDEGTALQDALLILLGVCSLLADEMKGGEN